MNKVYKKILSLGLVLGIIILILAPFQPVFAEHKFTSLKDLLEHTIELRDDFNYSTQSFNVDLAETEVIDSDYQDGEYSIAVDKLLKKPIFTKYEKILIDKKSKKIDDKNIKLQIENIKQNTKNINNMESGEILKKLGLFMGTEKGLELNEKSNRLQGLVMLVRLLGKADEARKGNYPDSGFTDIPKWAKYYVNYAKAEGLTKGISSNTFGSKKDLTAKDYSTFMLRALGYTNNEYSWQTACQDMVKLTKIVEQEMNDIKSSPFTRGSVAKMSFETLRSQTYRSVKNYQINKSQGKKLYFRLIDELYDQGVIKEFDPEDFESKAVYNQDQNADEKRRFIPKKEIKLHYNSLNK